MDFIKSVIETREVYCYGEWNYICHRCLATVTIGRQYEDQPKELPDNQKTLDDFGVVE